MVTQVMKITLYMLMLGLISLSTCLSEQPASSLGSEIVSEVTTIGTGPVSESPGEPSLGEPSLGEPSLGEPSLGEPSLGGTEGTNNHYSSGGRASTPYTSDIYIKKSLDCDNTYEVGDNITVVLSIFSNNPTGSVSDLRVTDPLPDEFNIIGNYSASFPRYSNQA